MQANHCLLCPPYRSTATSPPYHPILDLAAVNAPRCTSTEVGRDSVPLVVWWLMVRCTGSFH